MVNYMPRRGDICRISYEPHAGNEEASHKPKGRVSSTKSIKNKRPMLIVSDWYYGIETGDVVGMPITSSSLHHHKNLKKYLIPVNTVKNNIHGYIMGYKLNVFDFYARGGEKAVDRLSDFIWPEVDDYLRSILGLLD